MSEIVERVEKAIRDKAIERGYSINPLARHLAVAAIEAMREPTEAMAKAGSNTIDEKMPDAKALRQVLYIWADMIDEALK